MHCEVKDLSLKIDHDELIANDEIEQKLNFMYIDKRYKAGIKSIL